MSNWLRGMKYLLLWVGLPLSVIFLLSIYAETLLVWLCIGIALVLIVVVLPFMFADMHPKKGADNE